MRIRRTLETDSASSAPELAEGPRHNWPFTFPRRGPRRLHFRIVLRHRFRAGRCVVPCHVARNSLSLLAILEPLVRDSTTDDTAPEAPAGRAGRAHKPKTAWDPMPGAMLRN